MHFPVFLVCLLDSPNSAFVKKISLSLLIFFSSIVLVKSQTVPPKGISYQTIIRDSITGRPIEKSGMNIEFKLRDVATQTVEFYERHTNVNSNKYGLVNLVIGNGIYLSGSASTINMIKWFNDSYEVGISIDTSGTGVYRDLGYTKLWTVPYSFYSSRAQVADSAKKTMYADTAKKLQMNGIPNRLVKVGHNGKYVMHSHIVEDSISILSRRISYGLDTIKAGVHIQNKYGQHGFVVEGPFGSGTYPDINGTGTRLMWVPAKSAFRVGTLSSLSSGWNDNNVGSYSYALGLDVEAKGQLSIAMGYLSKANNIGAAAIGLRAESYGVGSVSLGGGVVANDTNSFVLGTGYDPLNPLRNNIKRSLMIGLNSNKPTLFIGPAAGKGYWGRVGIGIIKPLAQLHILDTTNTPIVLIAESQDSNKVEMQLMSKFIYPQTKLRFSYLSNNEGEHAATYFNRSDYSFNISTASINRVKISHDPNFFMQPFVGIGASVVSDTNVRLAIQDGHLQSVQSTNLTLQTISGNFSASISTINPVSTDMAGQIAITTTALTVGAKYATFGFARPYNTAPIMIISPVNSNSASEMGAQKIYITTTRYNFTIHMDQPDSFKPGTFIFNYFVIETKR